MTETNKDYYNTLKGESHSLFKDKGSKHFGYALPVRNEEDIKNALEQIRKKHHASRHVCYAWALGNYQEQTRANDDGEPSNSAGQPILGQIRSFELTYVLIAVVRYFGGVKLGVSGLINAYKTAAKEAIEDGIIIQTTIDVEFLLHYKYDLMNQVMRVVKQFEANVLAQNFTETCELKISIRASKANSMENQLNKILNLKTKRIEP